jgi:hypothetical protein
VAYPGRPPIFYATPRHSAAAALLLDTVTAAVCALSCNDRLKTTYTGPLIRVRRSSDNTESDIGYNGSNVLDRTALTTFTGAGNGFITKVYDQSGNTRDMSQTTTANQPQIVTSGTVSTSGGNVVIDWAGDGNDIVTRSDAASLTGDHDLSLLWLGRLRSTTGSNQMVRVGNTNGYVLGYSSGNMLSTWGSNPGNNIWTGSASTNFQYVVAVYDAAANGDQLYQNGSTMSHTTYNTAAISMANTELRWGYNNAPASSSTFILWNSILSGGDRGTVHSWSEIRRLA